MFDFDAAVQTPFRMQPGLRRVAPGQAQLTPAASPGGAATKHLHEKLAVLSAHADQALCQADGFDPLPALHALAQEAAATQPAAFAGAAGHWHAPALGWGIDAQGQVQPSNPSTPGSAWPEAGALLHRLPKPWRLPALLALAFAEDFAIVDGLAGTVPWMAVALPSAWAPEHKVGRHFTAIHHPVADNTLIQQAGHRLLQLVTAGERWERFVWTLSPQPRLHAHPDRQPAERWPAAITGAELAARTWFRTEHQTFIPVPGQTQAVFTIRVDTQPLPQVAADPARAARLHAALATMSPAVLAYRGLADVQPRLLAWLAAQAQPA